MGQGIVPFWFKPDGAVVFRGSVYPKLDRIGMGSCFGAVIKTDGTRSPDNRGGAANGSRQPLTRSVAANGARALLAGLGRINAEAIAVVRVGGTEGVFPSGQIPDG